MSYVSRGALIVVEGCDRSGKTTQCKKIVEALLKADIKAQYINFPNRISKTGHLIDNYLTSKTELPDEAIHLLFSANRWEMVPKIIALLREGITLIVDRYAFSGVAFSAAKGLNFEWCKQPDVGLPRPDKVFLLTMLNERMAERNGFGSERYERIEFQEKVNKCYLALEDSTWDIIDADRSMESVHEDLFLKCIKARSSIASQDIKKLWI